MASYEGITESQVGIEASTLTLDHDVSTCSTFLHMERVAKVITSHCLVFRSTFSPTFPPTWQPHQKTQMRANYVREQYAAGGWIFWQALAGAAREVFALQ